MLYSGLETEVRSKMLKKLTPRHRDIVRRLVVGQLPKEIAADLGISVGTIASLQNDPLFASEISDTEREIKSRLGERMDVMQRLEKVAEAAAKVVEGAVDGFVGGVEVPLHLRMKSAFDVLDRTGYNKPNKTQVEFTNPAELIIKAYDMNHGTQKQKVIEVEAQSV